MLRPEQEEWLAHLSDDDKIVIKPYDATAHEKFELVKQKIQAALGEETKVEHKGATSLGISGQDEIDVYVPVPPSRFDSLLKPLSGVFGEPKSLYPRNRARFVTFESGKHIDVFLINEESDGWKDGVKFETYLKIHPEALQAYRKLKENGDGLSTREYYRRKIEFINDILEQAQHIS